MLFGAGFDERLKKYTAAVDKIFKKKMEGTIHRGVRGS